MLKRREPQPQPSRSLKSHVEVRHLNRQSPDPQGAAGSAAWSPVTVSRSATYKLRDPVHVTLLNVNFPT